LALPFVTDTASLLHVFKWWASALVIALLFFTSGSSREVCGLNGDAPDVCGPAAGIPVWLADPRTTFVPLTSNPSYGNEYYKGLFFHGIGSNDMQWLEALLAIALLLGCVCMGGWQTWQALRKLKSREQ